MLSKVEHRFDYDWDHAKIEMFTAGHPGILGSTFRNKPYQFETQIGPSKTISDPVFFGAMQY